MPYPRQSKVQPRLEKTVRAEMREMERKSLDSVAKLWRQCKRDLKREINFFHALAQERGGWNSTTMQWAGHNISEAINARMALFRSEARETIAKEVKAHHDGEFMRGAYVLDVITPANKPVKLVPRAREAVRIHTGVDALVKWHERFGAWTGAYETALKANLIINAIMQNDAASAMSLVDTSRVGAPAMDMWSVIGRICVTEILGAQSAARQELADANRNIVMAEIWQTMEDEKVCPECGPLDGQETDEEPPLHPGCRCVKRLVPKDWADLADADLRRAMDDMGLVPDAMAIPDGKGGIKAAVIVSFKEWLQGQKREITA